MNQSEVDDINSHWISFTNAAFADTSFKTWLVEHAHFTESMFMRCDFEGSTMTECVFDRCKLPCSSFLSG